MRQTSKALAEHWVSSSRNQTKLLVTSSLCGMIGWAQQPPPPPKAAKCLFRGGSQQTALPDSSSQLLLAPHKQPFLLHTAVMGCLLPGHHFLTLTSPCPFSEFTSCCPVSQAVWERHVYLPGEPAPPLCRQCGA